MIPLDQRRFFHTKLNWLLVRYIIVFDYISPIVSLARYNFKKNRKKEDTLAKTRVLVRIERVNGKDESKPPFLRGIVPDLGVHIEPHPTVFVERAPARFQSLARIRQRGKKVDSSNGHVDPQSHMFLPLTLEV